MFHDTLNKTSNLQVNTMSGSQYNHTLSAKRRQRRSNTGAYLKYNIILFVSDKHLGYRNFSLKFANVLSTPDPRNGGVLMKEAELLLGC